MLAKISNPKIPESPHAPTPTPFPLRSTPPWKKIYRLYKLGPPEAAQLKGAGCAELRKREHETIKWEEIVMVFFFLAYPSIWWGAWNRVREPWHRGLFFSQVLVLMFAKNLWKRPNKWFAQPLRSSPARYWRKERTTFETLLLAYFLFKLMTWSAQSRTH